MRLRIDQQSGGTQTAGLTLLPENLDFASVDFEIDFIHTRLLPGFRRSVPWPIAPADLFELIQGKATPSSNLTDLTVAASTELEAKCAKPPGLSAQHVGAQQPLLPVVFRCQGLSPYDCEA